MACLFFTIRIGLTDLRINVCKGSPMWRALFVVIPLILLFIFAVAFGAHNKMIISVNFIAAQKDMTVASLLALFLGIGFLFGALTMSLSYWREKLRNRRLKKAIVKQKR